MKLRFILLLLLIPGLSFGWNTSALKTVYKRFDKLLPNQPKTAKLILDSISRSAYFQKNDSVKCMNYMRYAAYYYALNDHQASKSAYLKAIHFGINSKLFNKVSMAYHNYGQVFVDENKIDSARWAGRMGLKYASKFKDPYIEANSRILIGKTYKYDGQYDQSNTLLFDALKHIPDSMPKLQGLALSLIGSNYLNLKSPDVAQKYFEKADKYLVISGNGNFAASNLANLAEAFNTKGDYQKALLYADSILYYSQTDYDSTFYNLRKAEAYKGLQEWNKALTFINKTLYFDKKVNDNYAYFLDLITKGQIYIKQGAYGQALKILEEVKNGFLTHKIRDKESEAQLYRDLVLSHLKLKDSETANDYEHFLAINDSLINQVADKVNADMSVKYQTAQKERQIADQKLKIQKERNHRNVAIAGGAFILLGALGGAFIIRQKRKQEDLKRNQELSALQQMLIQKELKALNNQLTPHEFKNLLAGISPEIQEKAPESYRNMIRLLNVTKSSLNNSGLTDSLNVQLQQMKDYLDLLRQTGRYTFDLIIQNGFEKDIFLPRLLLKNLAENAIKHGIQNCKDNKGSIHLNLSEDKGNLLIQMDNTGKESDKNKQPSGSGGIALNTYKKLFEILNQKNHQSSAHLSLSDTVSGKRVEVVIPADYNYS